MVFSEKAKEIHDYIVSISATDDWIDRAQAHIERRQPRESGPLLKRNNYTFILELQAAFGNKFSTADDHAWEEIADWLFASAQS